jgi:glycosyltransferase involved in cell wall biosynthesis
MSSKVTVVIPTRERPDTLAKSLKTALNQDWPNLEVIVSDNFGGPETAEVVRAVNDPRVTYLNTGRRVSMSHNWEFAISGIEEGWIALIGDDDGLLPNSLGRVVRLAEKHGLEALSSNTCGYHWPSSNTHNDSILSVPFNRGDKRVDAKAAIKRVLDWKVDSLILPTLYTGGLISADLVNRIKSKRGAFFQSQIPDVYSGFAICGAIDEYIFTAEPFAIQGASRHSNGAALFRMEITPFLTEGNIPFHPDIPLPRSDTLTFSHPALAYEGYLQSQYIHGDFARVKPADMLELILSETHTGAEVLQEWAAAFASHHGIDFEKVAMTAKKRQRARRLSKLRGTLLNLLTRYRIGQSHELPIRDVFEASLVAAALLSTRPSLARNYLPTVRRVAKRPGAKAVIKRFADRLIPDWGKR